MARALDDRRPRTFTVAVAAAVVAVLAAGWVGDLLPSLGNPFSTERVDRSSPTLLQALEDLSEYRAAEAQLQVVVDVEDDTRFLPSALKGERTTFLAGGTVAASVDLSGLDEDAIEVSDDGRSVHITLPPARLSEPTVDPERSYVINRERGLLDRIGGAISDNPTSERELYLLAEDKLAAAAAEDDELVERAERNTEAMLDAMLGSLGYDEVTVTFAEVVDDRR